MTEESTDDKRIIRKYHANGKLKLEVPVEYNKKNGLAKSYYDDGQVRQTIEYLNGLKHGEARTYYENGHLYQVSRYKHNLLHGIRERYHPNGQLMSEAPFYEGNPSLGLKEYLLDGSPRKYYPLILVEEENMVREEGVLLLHLSLSDESRRVTFYLGDLHPAGYIDNRSSELKTEKGKATVEIELPKRETSMETISILAEIKTNQGNTYIIQHDYTVANIVNPA